jgi:hypothetical protein
MQRLITTIRADFSYIAVGLILALLVALLNFQSAGIVREGEDKGSGFGGTGRTITPGGGSGFGGTGLKPYLGMSSANEVIMLRPGLEVAETTPLRKPTITELITVISNTVEPVQSRVILTSAIFKTTDSSPLNITEAIQTNLDINVLLYEHDSLLNNTALAATNDASTAVERSNRLTHPGRIQRPQLPPIQRIRPIQRPSILPPRILPMRL